MNISTVTSGSVSIAPGNGTRAIAQSASTTSGGATSGVSTQAPSPGQIAQAVKQINNSFAQNGQNLYASIGTDKASGITVVKIVDSVTRDVVGQYPSKAIIAMADAADQLKGSAGQLLNIRA